MLVQIYLGKRIYLLLQTNEHQIHIVLSSMTLELMPARKRQYTPTKLDQLVRANTMGTIAVALSKEYYIPGEIVKGIVILKVVKQIPANRLFIQWKGIERTKLCWPDVTHRYGDDSFPHKQLKQTSNEKVYFNHKAILTEYPSGYIPPGTYHIPFNYELPKDLPATFSFQKSYTTNEFCEASIKYKVTVSLDTAQELNRTVELIILESSVMNPSPITLSSQKSFFLSRGTLQMNIDLEKDVWCIGSSDSPVSIKVQIDNGTSRQISKIKIKLIQEISIHSDKREKKLKTSIISENLKGVNSNEVDERIIALKLNGKLCPTTNGKHIQCSYRIEVECRVKMASSLSIETPIVLINKPVVAQRVIHQNQKIIHN
jgi:sporulation-control protein spo0M